MKTINNIEMSYEYSYNRIESMKNSFHEGEEIITMLDFCQDLLSDKRLNLYPDIEVSSKSHVVFNFENEIPENHLVIKISTYEFGYDDKVLSYYYIKGSETSSKANVSWNEVIDVIERWRNK